MQIIGQYNEIMSKSPLISLHHSQRVSAVSNPKVSSFTNHICPPVISIRWFVGDEQGQEVRPEEKLKKYYVHHASAQLGFNFVCFCFFQQHHAVCLCVIMSMSVKHLSCSAFECHAAHLQQRNRGRGLMREPCSLLHPTADTQHQKCDFNCFYLFSTQSVDKLHTLLAAKCHPLPVEAGLWHILSYPCCGNGNEC